MKNQSINNQKEEGSQRETVGVWLERPFVWDIPVYQRHYAWDADKKDSPTQLFWETVEEQTTIRLKGEQPKQHYLGAVMVDCKKNRQNTTGITHYDVVDGQQRLTSIQIAMLALISTANEHGCGDEIKELMEKYVFADKASNSPRLVPTNFDEQQFKALLFQVYGELFGVQNDAGENAKKPKICSAFQFFKREYGNLLRQHAQRSAQEVIREVLSTLTLGFDLVLIVLREDDDAQRVFESLNYSAEPLTTFDLIRNKVFHRAASIRRDMDVELFRQPNWKSLETPYWEDKSDQRKGRSTHIDAYVARMLVAEMRATVGFNRNGTFKAYKEFSGKFRNSSVQDEIAALVRYTDTYRYLDGEIEQNPVAPDADFGVLRHEIWKNRDFYPVIFRIVGSAASAEQKQKMLKLLECYVIRRGVCKLPSDNYNKHAVEICKALGDTPDYNALLGALKKGNTKTAIFPDNERVHQDCVAVGFYGSVFQRYVLEKIECSKHDRAVRVIAEDDQITIDHLLPQSWEKATGWKDLALDKDGQRDEAAVGSVNSHLHTIGNLTLLSGHDNIVLGNQPWGNVRNLLANSSLKMNRELAKRKVWNVEEIAARSRELAEKICEIWPYDVE